MKSNIIVAVVLVFGLAWRFDLVDPDARACRNKNNIGRMEACTRVINSNNWFLGEKSWAYTNRGAAHRKNGETDLALADFNQSITLNPGRGDTYYDRGLAYLDKKDIDRAIADFCHAIDAFNPRIFPLSYKRDYLNQRAIAYHRRGDLGLAMADYDTAIAGAPMDGDLYYNRGLLFATMKDSERAIADFGRAISNFDARRLSVEKKRNYLNARARVHKLGGDLQSALADYNESIGLISDAETYYSRGLLHSAMKDYDHAIADYSRAISGFNPRKSPLSYKLDYLTDRGNAYRAKGELEMALVDYEEAIAIDATFARAIKARAALANPVRH